MLQKYLESPWYCKEIKTVNPKGSQSCIFIGRTDAEAKAPIFWPPDAKNWLIGKDPDAGKDWRQEEKGVTEDKMVGWYHQLDGHEFGQALGVGDGQGGLACCSPWGCRVRHDWATELMNWTGLPCFLSVLLQVLKFLKLFKEPALYSIDFLYCFPDFNFINFCFYSFLPPGFPYPTALHPGALSQ